MELVIGWPQGIYLALTLLGLGVAAAKHGDPQTGRHNFWISATVTALIVALLTWGGFFG